jgi:hypothetical protein
VYDIYAWRNNLQLPTVDSFIIYSMVQGPYHWHLTFITKHRSETLVISWWLH